MPTAESNPNCEACQARVTPAPALAARMGKPAEQPLWRCTECGHIQVWPIPAEEIVATYYEYSEATRQGLERPLEQLQNGGVDQLAPTYRRRLAAVRRGDAPARLLDIGYGNGLLLREAVAMGFEATGVDFDDRHRTVDVDATLVNDRFRDGLFPPGRFDVVCANHVLEHVTDLEHSLELIGAVTRPGGHLLIELPHEVRSLIKNIKRRLLGERYSFFSSHQHLRFFTEASLRALLGRHGWEVRRCRSIPGAAYWQWPRSMLLWPLAPAEIALKAGHFLEAIAEKPVAD